MTSIGRTIRVIAYVAVILVCAGAAVLDFSIADYPHRFTHPWKFVHGSLMSIVVIGVLLGLLLPDAPRHRTWLPWVFALGTFLWATAGVWAMISPGRLDIGIAGFLINMGVAIGMAGCWRLAIFKVKELQP